LRGWGLTPGFVFWLYGHKLKRAPDLLRERERERCGLSQVRKKGRGVSDGKARVGNADGLRDGKVKCPAQKLFPKPGKSGIMRITTTK